MSPAQKSVFRFLFIALIGIFAAYFLFSPQKIYAQQSCSDDVYYWDSNQCIHKTGGYYDPDKEGDDKCVYSFNTISESVTEGQCAILQEGNVPTDQQPVPNTPTNPSPSTPASGAPTPAPTFTPVKSTTWGPEQQAAYTSGNLVFGAMCELVRTKGCPVKVTDGKTTQLVLYNGPPSGGAVGELTGIVVALYHPPTSTVQYIAGIGKNFGLGTPVYAQGTASVPGSGAGIIEPVRLLWQAVRNIAYLFFIFIFLVVGFMIMFRQKINPQTVVSVQTALPGLVVGLILVTFSYFIAALIIDFSFVGIPLVANVISQGSPPTGNAFGDANQIQEMAKNSSIFQMFATTAGTLPEAAVKTGGGIWDLLYSNKVGLVSFGIIGTVIGAIAGTLVFPGVGTLLGMGFGTLAGGAAGSPFGITAIASLVIPLILLFALFIQMFRLLLALIGTYLQLLVATITGPFVILTSSLPGRGGGIGEWLKNLVANALVFPAVFGAFLFAGVILATTETPETWRAAPPLFGGLSTQLLPVLLAYGVILATPGIPDAVRGAFGIKPQQGGIVGAALGGFMGGLNVAKVGLGKGTERYRQHAEIYKKELPERAAGLPASPRGYVTWLPWMRIFGGRRNP